MRDELGREKAVLFTIFDYYASNGSTNDVFTLGLNPFYLLIKEFELVDPMSVSCQGKHLEQVPCPSYPTRVGIRWG